MRISGSNLCASVSSVVNLSTRNQPHPSRFTYSRRTYSRLSTLNYFPPVPVFDTLPFDMVKIKNSYDAG